MTKSIANLTVSQGRSVVLTLLAAGMMTAVCPPPSIICITEFDVPNDAVTDRYNGSMMMPCVRVCVCMCVCVRACVRAYVRACAWEF